MQNIQHTEKKINLEMVCETVLYSEVKKTKADDTQLTLNKQ